MKIIDDRPADAAQIRGSMRWKRYLTLRMNAARPARYAVPALEKGLDILELLARSPNGLNLTTIAELAGPLHRRDLSHPAISRSARLHRPRSQ